MDRRDGWNRGVMSEKTSDIIEMRRRGKSLNEISRTFNVSVGYAGQVCRSAGMGGSVIDQRLSESQVADYVSKSGFDYVGGYQSQKKPITVRCRDCGRTFERLFHIFRDVANGTWPCANNCPLCVADRQKELREQKRLEKETERERVARIKAELRANTEALRISRQIERRLATRVCKNCGIAYTIESSGYDSEQYCSEKCMKRWAMRIKNDRRVRRMKTRKHDNDITLEMLFKNEQGICYLCGGKCEWSDVDSAGNAQDKYPSIDHVVPLSKGGTHTWNNVKLAHRGCNTAKRDKIYIP